ncbi:hypothetical protein MJO28_008959 [Puccinia striiformis f. sp. tritici]|uniref:C2H2-type domain-containing protein n=3 Tax=Puccinia striiformis TaxID=27350 RepID=A0A0L0UYU3_9BASI|nr:hypothetical protein Pst134EA_015014 [Puccinia striiformis f. sp. tritici]KAH9462927.1 hypothetical protein Pst134EA_015014 [Puccinia striiformis f. sp. tritici]KAI7950138.1 hypothetical protein MJO28_008959 [Puccinia striiformis f. sp. tritici]KNE92076.1 hypothetical protein PSTG_14507 [Puccinia striiformis f. sp. tritici PST-78]POV98990.1 hypothetical protein PSTT_14065 [Puccinia striiformis]
MAEPEQTHECQISRAQTDDYQDYHYPHHEPYLYHHHHHPAEGNLLDFDLDAYHHLFAQDLPSTSLELHYPPFDHSNFSPPLLHPIPDTSSSLLLSSSSNSSSSASSSSSISSSSGPSTQPACFSSPSWSTLDQLFLASLPHHPQSSPLFPLDLVPNNPILPEPAHRNLAHDIDYQQIQLNQLDDLSEFSFDTHLHDWNLSFDTASSENLQGSYDSAIRSSENDPYRVISQMNLPEEQGTFSTDEYLKDFYRPTAEGEEYDQEAATINHNPLTNLISPSPQETRPQTPILAMKRRRSSSPGQADQEEAPLGISDALCSLAHNDCNTTIAADQLIQSGNEEASITQVTLQPKSTKRPKNKTTNSSSSKPHICPECGKSFPRLTSLTQHKITHNGERPFRCGFEGCTKSFTTSSNTKRHWKTHF